MERIAFRVEEYTVKLGQCAEKRTDNRRRTPAAVLKVNIGQFK
ncbi:MAG: hypothetical protein AAFQ66_20775 [Pseudomonadota bacterium]